MDVYSALPLALPEGLVLQELTLVCTRLLVDWTKLCCQVGRGQPMQPFNLHYCVACKGGQEGNEGSSGRPLFRTLCLALPAGAGGAGG